MYDDVILVVRWTNVILGLTGFFWLLMKSSHHWAHYNSNATRALIIATLLFVFATLYTSAESIYQHIPAGGRSWFILIAHCNLLYALWNSRGGSLVKGRPNSDAD